MFVRAQGLRCKKCGFLKRLLSIGLCVMPCFLMDYVKIITAVRKDDLGQRFEPGTFTLRNVGAVNGNILFRFCSCGRDLTVRLQ